MNVLIYKTLIDLLLEDGTLIPIYSTIVYYNEELCWKPAGQKDSFHNSMNKISTDKLSDKKYFERIY